MLFYSVRRVLTDAARGAGYPTEGTAAELSSWAVLVPALFAFTASWDADGAATAIVVSSAVGLAVLVGSLLVPWHRRPHGRRKRTGAASSYVYSRACDCAEEVKLFLSDRLHGELVAEAPQHSVQPRERELNGG